MIEKKERMFYLNEDVDSKNMIDIVKGITNLIKEDEENDNKLKEFKRKPIHLFIDSYGGNCYDGLTLANILNESKTPIYTYCYGKAMSMGLYLFMQGTKRFVHEDSYLMYHQLSGFAWGKMGDLVVSTEQKLRLHKQLTKRISGKVTPKGRKKIKKSNKEKFDLYLKGKESLKFGFATDMIMYNKGESK